MRTAYQKIIEELLSAIAADGIVAMEQGKRTANALCALSNEKARRYLSDAGHRYGSRSASADLYPRSLRSSELQWRGLPAGNPAARILLARRLGADALPGGLSPLLQHV